MTKNARKTIAFLPLFTLLAAFDGIAANTQLPATADKNIGSQVREIIAVFKTHYDIGFTDLVTNILTRYRTQFADRALTVIDQSRSLPAEKLPIANKNEIDWLI